MTVRTTGAAAMVEAIRARRDKGKESISRDAMQDRRLSMKARGILAYLLSKPDEWRTNADAIAGTCDLDGREAIANGLKELEQFGYLVRIRRHGSGGQWCWCWVYSDDPTEVAEFVGSMDDLGNQARRGRVKSASSNVAMNGKPDPGGVADEDTMNGFPEDGSPVDGKPVDIEVQEIDLPPLPPAQQGEPEASPDPKQSSPTARPRCETHNRPGCRECGLSTRTQARVERKVRDSAGQACLMCIPDGTSQDGAIRWLRCLPGLQVPITPYDICDHSTPHQVRMKEIEAADAARIAASPVIPAQGCSSSAEARAEARRIAGLAQSCASTSRRSSRRKVAAQASAGGGE